MFAVFTLLTLQRVEVLPPPRPGALPRTVLVGEDPRGQPWEVVVPGSNGGPPAAVWGVPTFAPGQTWALPLVEAPVGWTLSGLGEGATLLDGPRAAPPWALNGLHYDATQLPLGFSLNAAGSADIGAEATQEVVQRALDAWSTVGCSTFAFEYLGTTDAVFEDDGQNVLAWADDAWDFDESIAGLTATRFGTDAEGNVIPVGADILFNGVSWAWTLEGGDVYLANPRLNADSVVLHELGHVTGMDHEYTLVASTMFFAYIGGDWQGSLSGDDRRGLCENYPSGSHECEEDADCAGIDEQPRACVALDGLRVCDEVRDEVGAFCARTDFNCPETCVFTDMQATEGYCTTACERPADCPDGYTCGEARRFLYDDPQVEERLCVPGEPLDTGDTAPPDSPPGDSGKDGAGGCACASSAPRAPALVPLALLALAGLRRRLSAPPMEVP